MREVLMSFVGDVHVNRKQPQEAFNAVKDILEAPDLRFANLEGAYTNEPGLLGPFEGLVCAPESMLEVYRHVGFNVMSLANNHAADAGYPAMLHTASRLERMGIGTCGAGECIAAARTPALIDTGGLRIAVLAYASVLPIGWEARDDAPGIAPMRAYNSWREPSEALRMPGAIPIVTTHPDEGDLAELTRDIHSARERADLVITSFHWGDQARPFYLTDHELRIARHCIDQGAHMVIGHHHHALRGMEWYKGRPVLYGLGHFVFDLRWPWSEEAVARLAESDWGRYFRQINYPGGPRRGWPLLPFPEDYRFNAIAWARATSNGIHDVGFIPCHLTPDGLVHPLQVHEAEGRSVIGYVERCNRTQGLNGRMITTDAPMLAGHQSVRVVPAGAR